MSMQAALVRSILEQWRAYEWTQQGFGFVRTKIQNVGRVHVWDSRLRTPLVSDVHTHPWPLRSTVISGELINQLFGEVFGDGAETTARALRYHRQIIATGEGGGLVGEPKDAALLPRPLELYVAGESYAQEPEEIHRTIAQDGTVTLIERSQGPPLEEALVYWPRGMIWISAEPRPIEKWELEPTMNLALARWSA